MVRSTLDLLELLPINVPAQITFLVNEPCHAPAREGLILRLLSRVQAMTLPEALKKKRKRKRTLAAAGKRLLG
jgi:hypothetical protein